MPVTKTLMLTCSCEKHRKFPYVLRVTEDVENEEIASIQLECPFNSEEYCNKHLNIELPPGLQPDRGEEVMRK